MNELSRGALGEDGVFADGTVYKFTIFVVSLCYIDNS